MLVDLVLGTDIDHPGTTVGQPYEVVRRMPPLLFALAPVQSERLRGDPYHVRGQQLPAAVRAAWKSGRLGTASGHPLWWDVPERQPGRTVLTDLAAGLGRPVLRGTNPSVWVTDRLLRGVPLLAVAGIHRLGATRTPRTSPVPALYGTTHHAEGTLLVVTDTATQSTLAAMPDSGSFLSHATGLSRAKAAVADCGRARRGSRAARERQGAAQRVSPAR